MTETHLEPLWTIEGVCRFLKMGRTWVREQMALPPGHGRLPHKYLGRALRFDPAEVRAWWARLPAHGADSPRARITRPSALSSSPH